MIMRQKYFCEIIQKIVKLTNVQAKPFRQLNFIIFAINNRLSQNDINVSVLAFVFQVRRTFSRV